MSDDYWDEIRARSEVVSPSGMKTSCGGCWVSYFHGAQPEGKPLPCPQHANADERARADRMLASPEFGAALRNHPLLAMTRRRTR